MPSTGPIRTQSIGSGADKREALTPALRDWGIDLAGQKAVQAKGGSSPLRPGTQRDVTFNFALGIGTNEQCGDYKNCPPNTLKKRVGECSPISTRRGCKQGLGTTP